MGKRENLGKNESKKKVRNPQQIQIHWENRYHVLKQKDTQDWVVNLSH